MTVLNENVGNEPQTFASEISNAIFEACSKAKIKPKKKPSKSGNEEPWFDKECLRLKNSIKKKCKALRKNNSSTTLHSEILKENKLLKNMIKKKKEEYKLKIITEMQMKKGDQKKFWKLLEKLKHPKNDIFKNTISGNRWNEHFKGILRDNSREINYPPNSSDSGPLDEEITIEELHEASYILKPNKSCGYDSISNEMILCLLEVQPQLLVKLFNAIFNTNAKIEQWSISIINPIFKGGSKMNPGDYRGISLISCLGKLFSAILNKRLLRYTLEKKFLKAEQLGFLKGNRTSDAHLIIHTLIQYYCHQNGKKIFACFVDFSKAFDTIPRDLLFKKLLGYGVTGKFFNTLKTLYTNDNCCIKVGNKVTNTFQANQGVKQGCILSPLLFNIFLADLVPCFENEECQPLKTDKSESIGCLLWADDIVLLSESGEGLQSMLQNFSVYVKENRMEINAKKTKCIIFNKTGRFLRRSFQVGEKIIFTTNTYKYLGFVMTPSGEINTGLQDLKDRALRSYYSLKSKMGRYFMLFPTTTIHLFDTCVKPILLYNSDFWGCLKLPKNNPIENVHMIFCKDLLGVQRQTTNVGVLLELGRTPIIYFGVKNCIKNWLRIHILGKANKILLATHKMSLNCSLKWTQEVKSSLDKSGIGSETKSENIFNMVFKRLTDTFYQEAFVEINREGSKLRTFGKLKTDIGMTKYLTLITHIDSRIALCKIRLSNHDLMIEKGRHRGINRTERFCPFCPKSVESEEHFLLQCKTFSILRNKLLSGVRTIVALPDQMLEHEKFKTLLTNERLFQQL